MLEELSCTVLFDIIRDEIREGKHDSLKKIKGIIEFHITVDGKERAVYVIDTKSSIGDVYEGRAKSKPNSVITIDDESFVKLCLGELDPVRGFMTGIVKVRGDILMMQKFNNVMKGVRKSVL